jgi:hypothetical protein
MHLPPAMNNLLTPTKPVFEISGQDGSQLRETQYGFLARARYAPLTDQSESHSLIYI